ncbi:MAG: cyclase family protein [Actinobacteria bacterium]|nr:cyclase family protein [Actinomycetota bacterium]
MKIIDLSGPIYTGMWSYGPPFPEFKLVDIKEPDWVESFSPKSQAFEGFCMLTGNYIDGPSHAFGLEKEKPMHEIPLEKIFGVDAYVYKFDLKELPREGRRPYITMQHVKKAELEPVPEEAPILLTTGWGSHWSEPDFLTDAWFLKKEVAEYFAAKKPILLGFDTPYADNLENEQGNWLIIYGAGVTLLGPLVNTEKIKKFKVKLYVAPLNILNTTGLPVRTIVEE